MPKSKMALLFLLHVLVHISYVGKTGFTGSAGSSVHDWITTCMDERARKAHPKKDLHYILQGHNRWAAVMSVDPYKTFVCFMYGGDARTQPDY